MDLSRVVVECHTAACGWRTGGVLRSGAGLISPLEGQGTPKGAAGGSAVAGGLTAMP